jgi:polysaccharide pyruvyl transferase WcaK-like protein
MRIGLLGQFGSGNLGNDGSLEAMLSVLRKSQTAPDLLCICSGPKKVEQTFGVRSTSIGVSSAPGGFLSWLDRLLFHLPHRLRNLLWSFRQSRTLDMLIIPGTGILDDFSETPFGWPYVILRWCLAAWLNRVPIYFFSIGAGPIRHPLSRRFMAAAARMASHRSFRDHQSRDFIRSLKIDAERDPVNCDLAFNLPRPATELHIRHHPMSVGVGMMAYTGWKKGSSDAEMIYDRYIAKMQDFAAWLLEGGMHVRLLTGGSDDRRAIEDLMERMRHTVPQEAFRRISAERTDSLHALMEEMAKTDIVVATRYHNIVCALNMERPTISLGYAEKNDELMARVGLDEFCQNVETFSTSVLKAQFSAMIRRRFLVEQELRQVLEVFRAMLEEQDTFLQSALDAGKSAEGVNAFRPVQARRG